MNTTDTVSSVDFQEEAIVIPIQVGITEYGWVATPIDSALADILCSPARRTRQEAIADLQQNIDQTLKALTPLMGKKVKVQEK